MSMVGVQGLEIQNQLGFVRECLRPEVLERLEGRDIFEEACLQNGAEGYGPVEAVFLYCFTATRRPHRVVQVGCGVSTAVILRAAQDFGFEVEITCIDPFPTPFLVNADRESLLSLLATPAQDVPLETFLTLGPGDLLFIDSTHTVKPGSEVNRIILEVLPRLADGVRIHFHDIWFPYDYSPGILTDDLFFWGENTLLHAFLSLNSRYRVLASLSTLHHGAQDELRALLPTYTPASFEHGYSVSREGDAGDFPSSLYLEALGS